MIAIKNSPSSERLQDSFKLDINHIEEFFIQKNR